MVSKVCEIFYLNLTATDLVENCVTFSASFLPLARLENFVGEIVSPNDILKQPWSGEKLKVWRHDAHGKKQLGLRNQFCMKKLWFHGLGWIFHRPALFAMNYSREFGKILILFEVKSIIPVRLRIASESTSQTLAQHCLLIRLTLTTNWLLAAGHLGPIYSILRNLTSLPVKLHYKSPEMER